MTLEQKIMHKLRYWQITLNLTDWIINFQLVPLKEICEAVQNEAYAYITYRMMVKTAIIYLPNDIAVVTLAGLPIYDFLIVHELLHLAFNPLNRFFEELEKLLPKNVKELFMNLREDNQELLINYFAKILVKMNCWIRISKEDSNEEGDQATNQEEI